MSMIADVSFSLAGTQLPVDHGYLLYAAICRVLPAVHANPQIGIHPIRGKLVGNRLMGLTRSSRLTLRVQSDMLPALLALSGKTAALDGHKLTIGVPTVYPLRSAALLLSRLVIIKGFMNGEGFSEAAQRQLDALGIKGKIQLGPRRTTRIKDKEVVGYAVAVSELDADESLLLQEQGIGGRRRFGCGVFAPRIRG